MYRKIGLVVISIILLTFLIISCDRDSKLVGKWELEKDTEVFLETLPARSSIEFTNDHKVILFGNKGTYEIQSNGKIKMIIHSQISFVEYTIKRDILTITLKGTDVMAGQQVTIQLKKVE